MKRLTDQRTEQLRLKEKQHNRSRELEQVERTLEVENSKVVKSLNDKNINKLHEKKQKLSESLRRTEKRYLEISIAAERTRAELEVTRTAKTSQVIRHLQTAYYHAAERLENIEQHRLTLEQSALGSYRQRIETMGPIMTNALLETTERMQSVSSQSVQVLTETQLSVRAIISGRPSLTGHI